MSIIKQDYGEIGGDGIDLVNPYEVKTITLSRTETATLTITANKKPKYIVMGYCTNSSMEGGLTIYDVENDTYYGTYSVNGSYTTGDTQYTNPARISSVSSSSFNIYNSRSSGYIYVACYLYE